MKRHKGTIVVTQITSSNLRPVEHPEFRGDLEFVEELSLAEFRDSLDDIASMVLQGDRITIERKAV